MFGSDFPFGTPGRELSKIMDLPVSETIRQAIAGENFLQLMQKQI
jgi:predicted TIM-barrel fold metal-dependent hydrolase